MSAAISVAVDTLDAKAKTLRPATPVISSVECPRCEGNGDVEVMTAHGPRTFTCSRCSGAQMVSAEPYEVDDLEDGQIHVWTNEDAFLTDAPAVCGRESTDTREHVVGDLPHCLDCFAALDAWRSR